jgi:hypothetical protein
LLFLLLLLLLLELFLLLGRQCRLLWGQGCCQV